MNALPIKAILERGESTLQGTFGVLKIFDEGEEVLTEFVSELPWRDNAPGLSCIPPGEYEVEYLARSASGKYHDVYHVLNVPGRTGILIHPGNFVGARDKGFKTHSWGCILPASRVGYLQGPKGRQKAGLASKPALNRLHDATGRQSFRLEIRSHV